MALHDKRLYGQSEHVSAVFARLWIGGNCDLSVAWDTKEASAVRERNTDEEQDMEDCYLFSSGDAVCLRRGNSAW